MRQDTATVVPIMSPVPPRLPLPATASLGLLALICTALAAWRPGLFFVDDAWFYLQIGRNLALGGGSSFHGGDPTNGYHPLWQGIVALLGLVAGGHKGAMLVLVLATQALLVALALPLLLRLGRRAGLAWPELVMAAVILGLLSDRAWGSEGMLNLAMHAIALLAWQRALERPEASSERGPALVGAGVLAGLMVLARLDLAFLALAMLLWTARRGLRPSLALAMGMALPVLPYLVANLVVFGHPVPVSGAIKSTFPVLDLGNPLHKLGRLGALAAGFAVLNLGFAARKDSPGRPLLFALGLGALLHGAYTALFTRVGWSTDVVYYYVTGVLGLGFGAGELLRRYMSLLPSLGPRGRDLLVGGLGLLIALGGTGRALRGAWDPRLDTEALADWLAANLPAGSRVATVDAPGRLAWRSGLPVLALDGLTQGPDFSEELARDGVQAWAARVGVSHLVSLRKDYRAPWVQVERQPGGVILHVLAPASGAPAGELVLHDPPLFDLCSVQAADACLNPVGVWAWPSPE